MAPTHDPRVPLPPTAGASGRSGQRAYTPHEKWEILLEALGSPRGPDEVCLRRGISLIELRRWLSQAREGALARLTEGLEPAAVLSSSVAPAGLSASAAPAGLNASAAPAGLNASAALPVATPAVALAVGSISVSSAGTIAGAVAAAGTAAPPRAPAGIDPDPGLSRPASAPEPATAGVSAASGPGVETPTDQGLEDIDGMFSTMSHELKEPLRGVRALCQFLEEDFREVLPERGLTYLETLANTVERMQRLVDGLSEFARTPNRVVERQPVALSGLLEQVRAQAQPFLAPRRGSVVVDSRLPIVQGDPVALAAVFRHLIQNGIKFNQNPSPRVEIVGGPIDPVTRTCQILVRDNGIGIDARHFERLFDLFSRLHRYDEYPGAGVGLAVARKIIRAHGGDLEVESVPGQGTTFKMKLELAASP